MIKKIQKYLLLNQPILWNIRIVPMAFILTAIHLIFFGIGYISTDSQFQRSYYYGYSPTNDIGLLYFVCVLVGILLLIGWLVYYNRNNGFKTFYPRKTHQLYMEWLLILAITMGIAFLPFTLTQGYLAKWKSTASLAEVKSALNLLDMAEVLIPHENGSYSYDAEHNEPIPIPDGLTLDTESLNLSLYHTRYSEEGGLEIKGYIGPSLLFYKNNYYEYYYSYEKHDSLRIARVKKQELVKKWLKEEKRDSIYAIIKSFDKLRKKHKLKTDLTPEKWFLRVYRPPFYPVTRDNIFIKYVNDEYGDYETSIAYSETNSEDSVQATAPELEPDYYINKRYNHDYDYGYTNYSPHLPYNELRSGYEQILQCYEYNSDTEILFLICVCVALMVSIFIFSFRVTGGRPWLIALVSAGILIFIVILTGIGIRESIGYSNEEIVFMFMSAFWVILFFGLLVRIIMKINNNDHKGKSAVYTNFLLWLLPCITPLSFLAYAFYIEYNRTEYPTIKDEDFVCMFWANPVFTILAMWLISAIIRRWKSLPEE